MMRACLLFDPSKECAHQTKMRPFWRCWCQSKWHETLGTGKYKVEEVWAASLSYPLSRRWLFQPAKPQGRSTAGNILFKPPLAFILLPCFLLEFGCFIMLGELLLYSKVNQLHVHIHPLFVTEEHWVELPLLHSRFSLIICFIHSSAYMSIPASQFS